MWLLGMGDVKEWCIEYQLTSVSDAVTQSSETTVGKLVERVPADLVTFSTDVERHGVGKVLKGGQFT